MDSNNGRIESPPLSHERSPRDLGPSAQPAHPRLRRLGLLQGQCQVPDDFDQIAADEIADLFEGH
ncbi:hypothetical protein [Vulcanococcus limneticus]|uniref:hypothetical protein n=1 Tax=Vulcanococcus limneticus TaxID=2170428 RepID=UPI00398BE4F9